MPRQLSSRTTVALLKQEAKRWLSALRREDADAQQRLRTIWPGAPADPTLRDVQHALAREHGLVSWVALLDRIADLVLDRRSRTEWVEAILSHGWTGDIATARRIAQRAPELSQENVFTAAAMGDRAEVARRLAQSPELVRATCAVRGWTALAHVMYGRLDEQHAVGIATLLLDAHADVHFRFDDGWGSAFTLLTGVAGDGEGAKPAHAQADELTALLLARGIDPFDTQLLYNTSLHHDDTTWLERLWDSSAQRGALASWRAHEGRRFGGRFPGSALDYLLGNAVQRGHVARTAWLLAHGANAQALHAYSGRPVHTEALMAGFREGVALLERYGARPEALSLHQQFVAAVMAGDEEATARLAADHPELVRLASPTHTAAVQGRVEIVHRLLLLGADANASDHEGSTPLHRAAQGGFVPALDLLLSYRADIDRRDARFHATALEWAVVLGQTDAVEFLVPRSRDVRALARLGEVDRLGRVLNETPGLAAERVAGATAPTALFCLAEDDEIATEVVRQLLAHGADRAVRDAQGRTAADVARSRGLAATARLLESGG